MQTRNNKSNVYGLLLNKENVEKVIE